MTRSYTTTFVKIGIVIGTVVGLFVALSSTQAIGTTFATGQGQGGLELLVDSTTWYNGALQPALSWNLKNLKPGVDRFFRFKDVKPGDTGTSSISVHIKKSSAWVCLDFINLNDRENGRNEPESHVDHNNQGELSAELEFFAWFDDGDNKFEVGEKSLFGTTAQAAKTVLKGQSYAIADSTHGLAVKPNKTKYVGINWCAGDLSVDLTTATITCDGNAMGNEAQTDSMSLDISLRAVSSAQQPKFTCTKTPHWGGGHGGYDDGPGCYLDDNHHDDDDKTAWTKPKKEEKRKWFAGWSSFSKYFN